jgi:hypothetical protein
MPPPTGLQVVLLGRKEGRARHHREGLAGRPAPDAPDLADAVVLSDGGGNS